MELDSGAQRWFPAFQREPAADQEARHLPLGIRGTFRPLAARASFLCLVRLGAGCAAKGCCRRMYAPGVLD